jgi:hypothetical protein
MVCPDKISNRELERIPSLCPGRKRELPQPLYFTEFTHTLQSLPLGATCRLTVEHFHKLLSCAHTTCCIQASIWAQKRGQAPEHRTHTRRSSRCRYCSGCADMSGGCTRCNHCLSSSPYKMHYSQLQAQFQIHQFLEQLKITTHLTTLLVTQDYIGHNEWNTDL